MEHVFATEHRVLVEVDRLVEADMMRLNERATIDAPPHATLLAMGEERRARVPRAHLRGRIAEHAAHEADANLHVRAIAVVPLQRHEMEVVATCIPLAVGEHAVVRTVRHHPGDAAREHLGGEGVVRIGEEDVVAARGIEADVSGGAHAPVLLCDDADTRILGSGGRENRSRVVRRAVVHENCLVVAKRLRTHAVEASGKRVRDVPAGDDQ